MKIHRQQLEQAAHRGLLQTEQVAPLWQFLEQDAPAGFRFAHVLYYLGGLIAMGAMTLFMTLGWQLYGGWALVGLGLLYALPALALAEGLQRRRLWVPSGIIAAFVICLTPITVYGLQYGLGWWDPALDYRQYHRLIHGRWLSLELATLAVGALMLWRYRQPFLMLPLAATLWYMSMDLTEWLIGRGEVGWNFRQWVSLWFGLSLVVLAFWVDIRNQSRRDFAFWFYLFGAVTFWGGLSLLLYDDGVQRLLFLLVNLLMILTGTLLARRVFVALGGLGVAWYLGWLAWDVFEDSLLFPLALTAIGLAVMGLGILWQRHQQRLTKRLQRQLPAELRALLARRE
ncbi:DUF2157 domain-containing protein [Zobellella sp. DQSA1]|uniref:DUF2157 domain-containing protein n=1 Tax=Zobellella sp. DQSA1 TaxID=3342386 RepID=UPI0035C1ECB9